MSIGSLLIYIGRMLWPSHVEVVSAHFTMTFHACCLLGVKRGKRVNVKGMGMYLDGTFCCRGSELLNWPGAAGHGRHTGLRVDEP